MPFSVVVYVDLSKNNTRIRGVPIKYSWNDDIEVNILSRQSETLAMIDPVNLTKIYILLEQKSVCVEAKSKPSARVYNFTVQEDFWGNLSIRLFRKTSRSKKYNDEQPWISAAIPPNCMLGYHNQVRPHIVYTTI